MSFSTRKFLAGLAVSGLLLTACGGGDAAPDTTAVVLQKNSALGKACSALSTAKQRRKCREKEKEATGAVSDVANDAIDAVGGAGNSAINAVSSEYKNAQNKVVDAAGTVLDAIPTSWPDSLSLEVVSPMFSGIVGQVKGIVPTMSSKLKTALDKASANFDTLTASEAENKINDVLATPGKAVTKAINIPGFSTLIAPYTTPLKVKVKEKEWNEKKAVNVIVNLDFFGVKKYEIGLACLGWPNGLNQAPNFVLNGGCDNPWNILANAETALNIVKDNAAKFETEVMKMKDQMISTFQSLAKGASNPRNIPPLAIDLPLNELLGAITSGGVPSLEGIAMSVPIEFTIPGLATITVSGSDFDWSSQPDDNKDGKKEERDKKKKEKQDSKKNSKGAGFSLYPELEAGAIVDATWTSDGKIEFEVGVGWFGISLMSVGLGCFTMGTTWTQTPSFTFQGGCDNKWNVNGPSQSYVS